MYKEITDFIKSQFPGQEFIPLHEPRFVGNERKYVLDCIDSTFVSSVGKFVEDFEKNLAEHTGAKYAVACVNGTAALHMALIVNGVKMNDVVLTQPLSFIATCNAISYIGATPAFVDVDTDTLGLSPAKLADFLKKHSSRDLNGNTVLTKTGQKISACVPMHTFGHPCRIDEIALICREHNIELIEDAAESIGSKYKGRHTGTFGSVGTFSFNGNKTITCGGGGAIITNDPQIAKLAKHLTTQAKVPHRWEFMHDQIGYNYRMPNLNAAMMCAQMEQLDFFLSNKRELAASYEKFCEEKSLKFIVEPSNAESNYWLCCIQVKDKETQQAFLSYTNDNGVMTRPVWTLMNRLPMFSKCFHDDVSNAQMLEDTLINIPSSVRIQR